MQSPEAIRGLSQAKQGSLDAHITGRRYNDDLQYSIALEVPAPCYEGNVAVDP